MTPDKERLRVLAEAATPGPWTAFNHSWAETSVGAPSTSNSICLLDINHATEESQADDEAQMAANAEFIAAAREAIPALLSENAAKDKQLAAYAQLQKSIEDRMRLASAEHANAIEARDSLQSERDANAILTAENAALAAENERLRKDAGHTEPMTRFCPSCGSVGDVPKKYRDCCPDGSDSRVIPAKLAKQCHDLFKGALKAAMADKGGAPS